MFISPKDEHSLIQLPRTFNKPMGIALDHKNQKLGLACKDEITIFKNSASLAEFYPRSPKKYDALYMPRMSFYTGGVDIHDLNFGDDNKMYGINTLFSCISTFDDNYNFTPYWKPNFISKIVAEDRCHLNGMAMLNGKPKYVSMFNRGDSAQSWRENITKTGCIIDIGSNEVLIEGLAMPHTPKIINDKLYILSSAKGTLSEIDQKTGKETEIINLGGFVRGMGYHKEYLFIGLSKLRKNSSTFSKLDIPGKENQAGIVIVHLPTRSLAGKITYHNSVDEIYDVHVLPQVTRPNIINTTMPESKQGISIPSGSFWAKPKQEKNEV